jgi:urea transport system ATP-binding protein
VGRKFQTPSVFTEHTVFNNLVLSLKGSRGVFASIFNRLSSSDRDRLDELIKLIRLDGKRAWKAGQLAHGEKQWLEIGMLLAQEPKILLVDEPAAGMTDEETHRTGELLVSLAGKHSIIVIEHDMTFVKQIARNGQVTVLHQGSVLCEGKFDDVQANPKVREVYLGRGKAQK